MSWQQTEFILKGIYLGLLLFVGMELNRATWWWDIGYVALWTFGGLVLFLGVAAVRKLREGYRVHGRLFAFLLFLLLENPGLVYAGIVLGLAGGAFTLRDNRDTQQLVYTLGGGVILGLVFWQLVQIRKKQRVWFSLAMAVALVGGAIYLFQYREDLLPKDQRMMIGTLLLLGIPLFYLLTFASMVEETEIEIGAICAALGVSLWVYGEHFSSGSPGSQTLALAVPLILYFFYTLRVLPGLRVFKHVLRGISYANVERWRPALVSLNRALQLDPPNKLAREQLWSVHRRMDLTQVMNDPETLALVNYELCLERVAWLLLLAKPSPDHLKEAHHLLDLISSQRPEMLPRCDYWRAVAYLHEKDLDRAALSLTSVLTGASSAPDNPHRKSILVEAWHLALLGHKQMALRVGDPQVSQPHRRMEAIAAVERRLTGHPDDALAQDLKRLLYSDLKESEYLETASAVGIDGPLANFDYEYCHQLGLALVTDASKWERGGEYLRIAAHGLPNLGPRLYVEIAKAHDRAGNAPGVWQNYELAKRAGRSAGPKTLSADDRRLYFAVIKLLAEDAVKRDDLDAAIENYHAYTEYERAGVETYRHLAGLYARRANVRVQEPASQAAARDDVWAGLRCTEQGLTYDSTDKDLLERKWDLYLSVLPDEVEKRWDDIRKWFDSTYCMNKARAVLDRQTTELDPLDWADHLVQLAQMAQPASVTVRVLRARLLRRRGEVEQAVALLEEVRTNKPEKFPSTEEEESWYLSCRLLGDIYLHEKPEQAIACFQEYRKSPKAGADTSYKLGVAYEHLGDRTRAIKCYQQVTAFEDHPLAPEANEALSRLQQQQPAP
ncbi:MAG TPA: tetratricopeptide repeat protein [Gemmataceae bacterium]|nr:tetratricopeptide repeat protein [Gemmataceae bacterium]